MQKFLKTSKQAQEIHVARVAGSGPRVDGRWNFYSTAPKSSQQNSFQSGELGNVNLRLDQLQEQWRSVRHFVTAGQK